MRREDIMVEVRDRNMQRRGQITTKYLRLSANIRHNKTGDWKLTLPGAHPMVPHLSAAGAGIVVSYRANPAFSNVWSTLFSGPTSLPSRERNREQPDGTFVFEGRTDGQLLDDARAYPQPSNADVSTQAVANDVRVGAAETIMRQYVSANIGPAAPVGRKGGFRDFIALTAPDLGRGGVVTKSPRFQIVSELLSEIGTLSQLGFQLVQRNDLLEFEVLPIVDRSAFVRFDIANGTLTSEQVQVTPPAVTRAIVAGQGEGADRTIIQRTTTAASDAESDWGRIIERFIDQRDTDDLTELQQSGDEALIEEGFVATNVKVVPADDTTMLFVRDWNVGDIVTVVVNGQETKTTVTEAVMLVDSDRCIVGAAIGDVRGFNPQDALTKRVEDTERRVERMERTAENVSETQISVLLDGLVPVGAVQPFAGAAAPAQFLLCDGTRYSRLLKPKLYAAIGTAFGSLPIEQRRNLFKNPGMEGTQWWAGGNCTAAYDTAWKLSGTRSLKLTATGTADCWGYSNADYSNGALALYGLTAGQTYTVSGTIYRAAPGSGTKAVAASGSNCIRVLAGTSGTPSYDVKSAEAPNIAGATRVSVTFTIPGGTTYFAIRFQNGYSSGVCYWDEVMLESGGVLLPWFSGDTAADGSVAWLGGANDSVSISGTPAFSVPDLRGRAIVGVDASQAEFDELGIMGGAKTHTLTTAEMPAHSHTDSGHSHGINMSTSLYAGGIGTAAAFGNGTTHGNYGTVMQNGNAQIQNTGGGGAHNNLQPYTVMNYIIRAE